MWRSVKDYVPNLPTATLTCEAAFTLAQKSLVNRDVRENKSNILFFDIAILVEIVAMINGSIFKKVVTYQRQA